MPHRTVFRMPLSSARDSTVCQARSVSTCSMTAHGVDAVQAAVPRGEFLGSLSLPASLVANRPVASCIQFKSLLLSAQKCSKPCQFMSPLCGATQGRNTLSHFDSSRPIGAKTGETRRAAVYTHPFQAVTLAAITGRQLDQPQQIQAPCNIHAIALRECLAPTLPARWTAERNSQSVVLLA